MPGGVASTAALSSLHPTTALVIRSLQQVHVFGCTAAVHCAWLQSACALHLLGMHGVSVCSGWFMSLSNLCQTMTGLGASWWIDATVGNCLPGACVRGH